MKRLKLHPDILNIIERYDNKDAIGVHIPDPDDADFVPAVYRRYAAGKPSRRNQISFNSYRFQIARILKTKPDQTFFIATDTKRFINNLKFEFTRHVVYAEETCALPIPACIRMALAEIIILSRTQYLLGDVQNSFTETVAKFAESTTFRLLEPDRLP